MKRDGDTWKSGQHLYFLSLICSSSRQSLHLVIHLQPAFTIPSNVLDELCFHLLSLARLDGWRKGWMIDGWWMTTILSLLHSIFHLPPLKNRLDQGDGRMDGKEWMDSLGHQLLQGSIFYLFFMNNNPEEVGTLGHLLVTVSLISYGQLQFSWQPSQRILLGCYGK